MELPFRIKDSYKQRKLKFLKEMVNFYSEDTERRASDGWSTCFYFKDGKRCAIGRWMENDSEAIKTEGDVKLLLYKHPDSLPTEIRKLGVTYLLKIQGLHDLSSYWCENSLTIEGEVEMEEIVKQIKTNLL